MDQVDLAQIRLRGVGCHAGAVLHGDARVRVAFDAEAFQERDARTRLLAEAVLTVFADANDDGSGDLVHSRSMPAPQTCRSCRPARHRPGRRAAPARTRWRLGITLPGCLTALPLT